MSSNSPKIVWMTRYTYLVIWYTFSNCPTTSSDRRQISCPVLPNPKEINTKYKICCPCSLSIHPSIHAFKMWCHIKVGKSISSQSHKNNMKDINLHKGSPAFLTPGKWLYALHMLYAIHYHNVMATTQQQLKLWSSKTLDSSCLLWMVAQFPPRNLSQITEVNPSAQTQTQKLCVFRLNNHAFVMYSQSISNLYFPTRVTVIWTFPSHLLPHLWASATVILVAPLQHAAIQCFAWEQLVRRENLNKSDFLHTTHSQLRN